MKLGNQGNAMQGFPRKRDQTNHGQGSGHLVSRIKPCWTQGPHRARGLGQVVQAPGLACSCNFEILSIVDPALILIL